MLEMERRTKKKIGINSRIALHVFLCVLSKCQKLNHQTTDRHKPTIKTVSRYVIKRTIGEQRPQQQQQIKKTTKTNEKVRFVTHTQTHTRFAHTERTQTNAYAIYMRQTSAARGRMSISKYGLKRLKPTPTKSHQQSPKQRAYKYTLKSFRFLCDLIK